MHGKTLLNMDNLRRRAILSLFSSYASQLATTGANLATKLILARLIAPSELGIYSLALLVTLGGDMLIDLGISQHIVREKERPYGNFLALRLAISIALFAIIQIMAPVLRFWGADFPSVIRVISLVLVIKAISGVPNVFLDRELLIHKSLVPQFARIIAMGLISIVLAYYHYGIWALVWGTVIAEILFAALIWQSARGHMHMEFTWRYTGKLVWGSKYLFLIGMMGFALQQGDVAVIGALLSPTQVGYYTMAFTFIVLVSKVVESAVFRVIYPMFCEYSQNMTELGRIYRLATLAITSVEAPIYFYLLFNAPVIVELALGKKWLPSAVLMQALSVFGVINPFSTFGNEVLRAKKRDSILTFSSIIGALTLLSFGYILTLRYGTMGVVIAHYFIIGSIPTIAVVYRILRADFIKLAWQLAIVYATSFASIAVISIALSSNPRVAAIVAGLIVPICWYIYYRAFGNDLGRRTLSTLMDLRSTASAELSPQSSNSG